MKPYTITRSKRKTLAIHITKDATVEVRAPLRMPEQEIHKFLSKKEKWIDEHIDRREKQNEEKSTFNLSYGDTVLLCGQLYPIRSVTGNRVGFDGESVWMPGGLTHEEIKGAVIQVYKAVAKKMLMAKAGEFAARMGVKPAAVKVTSAKTRWGSCSGKNNINFSWRLIMAEADVIDYVVIHELAHIRELNHSPRFWEHVEEALPDYQDRRKKLRKLQESLSTQDWD
ncbi:MAG: M48 family metallopeptidase [Peptococcaceae bacterium]|jgi:predicted metal-dependent hydrolase|nr:M48 family metallopeptidase [Peptococcaceae bacterium]